jgi:hypothetical protein
MEQRDSLERGGKEVSSRSQVAGGFVTFQSPCPHGRAVVYDSSVGGGGGIGIFLNFFYFYFFLETFQSLLKHGASWRCHSWSREIHLSAAERR